MYYSQGGQCTIYVFSTVLILLWCLGEKSPQPFGNTYKHDTFIELFSWISYRNMRFICLFFFTFYNQRDGGQYIGMLRHCTVTAVKTSITLSATIRGGQARTCQTWGEWGFTGYPGGDRNIGSLCKYHHSLFDFKHRHDTSGKVLSLFPSILWMDREKSNNVGLLSPFRTSFPLTLIFLLQTQLCFVFNKAQTLSVSSDIHWEYDCCHMTLT